MAYTRVFTLTRRAAAERLGVHPETLRRWAKAGKVDFERTLGGYMRFCPEDIERLRTRVHGVVRVVDGEGEA